MYSLIFRLYIAVYIFSSAYIAALSKMCTLHLVGYVLGSEFIRKFPVFNVDSITRNLIVNQSLK